MSDSVENEVYAFPLSSAQKRLWILSQFEGVSNAYNIPGHLFIKGPFNVEIFNKAVNTVIARHESLRTTFDKIDDNIVQIVIPNLILNLTSIDIRLLSKEKKQKQLKQAELEESRFEFDLKNGPLLRMKLFHTDYEEYHLLFTMHHIISDGWSIGIFISEMSKLYEAFLYNKPSPLEELQIQYGDYAAWQKEWLTEKRIKNQIAYWCKKLKGAPSLLQLPTDKVRPTIQSFEGKVYSFTIDIELTNQIKKLSLDNNATLFMTLLSVFSILLSKYCREQDIVIGTPNANRNRKEIERLIGFFVNTLLLRIDLTGNPSFIILLERIKSLSIEAYEHQDINFEKILEEIKPERNLSYNPLFQVMFSFENLNLDELKWPNLITQFIKPESKTSKFDLSLAIEEHPDVLVGKFEYNTNLFNKETIKRIAAHYLELLKKISENPAKKIGKLSLLTPSEEHLITKKWNSTSIKYPIDKCIHELFETSVFNRPKAEALQYDKCVISYSDLNKRANKLAHYLNKSGVKKGTLVGIIMERSIEMVVSLLAILKTGGTYVPLDPTYPRERLEFIIKDAQIALLISQQKTTNIFSGVHVINVDKKAKDINAEKDSNLNIKINSNQLAYVIYTSGSTGLPKGVEIKHKSVVNFLCSMKRQPSINENDVLLAVTSLSFDIAVLEIFLPLIVGGKVIVASQDIISNGIELAETIKMNSVSIMQATPTTWKILLNSNWEGNKNLTALCGGEAFPNDLAKKLLNKTKAVWNMYGPTETTIWSTIKKLDKENNLVSIGKPIANTNVYLLDSFLNIVPIGVPAELYIGGDGVAKGYLNRPSLTKERFITPPLWIESNTKLYRTGDLVKYQEDGNILFIGRVDHQIKLNGHRIELGEIENVLLKNNYINETVVIIKEDKEGNKRLIAYIVINNSQQITIQSLRNFLIKKLPSYMVPTVFIPLKEFPLTPNGKIDKKALPESDGSRPNLGEGYVAPQTEEEKLLTEIWSEVLEIDSIGIYDNFFELGGASLQSISVANKATEAGIIVTPELIFEHQTIKELANVAEKVIGIHTAYHTEEDLFKLTPDALYEPEKDIEITPDKEVKNIIIESLGEYLPSKEVSSKEIVDGCKVALRFPMERLTGIKSRKMVSEGEYALELAIKAIEKCFSISKYSPEHIDLFICCNVFRFDGNKMISFEPGTSMKLKNHLGLKNAMVYDISNACAGIFTAINIADSYIKSGSVKNVLIASGEYLTHLTRTSQLEVESYMDQRIAGLTVGDSGLAMILEESPKKDIGFQEMEMFTMGAYSSLCVVKATEKKHGGLVVNTDAISMAKAGHIPSSKHAFKILKKGKWTPEEVKYLIMHQASSTTLKNTMREINKLFKQKISHEGNTIDNIARRGNTATTTHFMAVADNIYNNNIQSGDKVVFCISGSGLNLGTALYTFDNLPDKLKLKEKISKTKLKTPKNKGRLIVPLKRITIEGIGTKEETLESKKDIQVMLKSAVENCLEKTNYTVNDISVIIFAGVYRNDFVLEPAIASLLAGEIGSNATNDIKDNQSTFVFDLFNGAIGFLNSCVVATQMLQTEKANLVMVTAGEIENQLEKQSSSSLNLAENASAMLLSLASNSNNTGFEKFFFKDYPKHIQSMTTYATWENGNTFLKINKTTDLEDIYVMCIKDTIDEMVNSEELKMNEIAVVFPPQISLEFISKMKSSLGWNDIEMICAFKKEKDLFTSSIPFSLQAALVNNKVKKGDKGLIISVGSGIQVGCAIYQF